MDLIQLGEDEFKHIQKVQKFERMEILQIMPFMFQMRYANDRNDLEIFKLFQVSHLDEPCSHDHRKLLLTFDRVLRQSIFRHFLEQR